MTIAKLPRAASPSPSPWTRGGNRLEGRKEKSSEHVDLGFDLLGRHDMPLQFEFLGSETERETDELRQVEDRQVDFTAGLLGRAILVAVEIQMAQRAPRNHAIGALFPRLALMLRRPREPVCLVRGENREAATFSLACNIG